MTKNTTAFYVETGNWRSSIILNVKLNEVKNYDYIEAATLSIESVFSGKKNIVDGNFELISLLDTNGCDYFDPEYSGELSDIPDRLFGLLTACFLEKDIDNPKNWWYFLTSKLFANAALHYNVDLALGVESKYSEQVKAFKLKELEIIKSRENDIDIFVKKKKTTKKKNKKPPEDGINPTK